MYHVYVLKSVVRSYIYVGMTDCVERRFREHQLGRGRSTASYRPFELILVEDYPTRLDARKREKYLKSGVGKEWIKEYIRQMQK